MVNTSALCCRAMTGVSSVQLSATTITLSGGRVCPHSDSSVAAMVSRSSCAGTSTVRRSGVMAASRSLPSGTSGSSVTSRTASGPNGVSISRRTVRSSRGSSEMRRSGASTRMAAAAWKAARRTKTPVAAAPAASRSDQVRMCVVVAKGNGSFRQCRTAIHTIGSRRIRLSTKSAALSRPSRRNSLAVRQTLLLAIDPLLCSLSGQWHVEVSADWWHRRRRCPLHGHDCGVGVSPVLVDGAVPVGTTMLRR